MASKEELIGAVGDTTDLHNDIAKHALRGYKASLKKKIEGLRFTDTEDSYDADIVNSVLDDVLEEMDE